jgi:ribonuclease J
MPASSESAPARVAGSGKKGPAARLVFLGGLGEIGRNMAALELGGEILLLDCGLSFPEEDMPGVDLVLPDWEYLRERRDAIRGAVLTHGHEDHVGALPYMLREFEMEIYATKLTLGMLKGKLEEHGVTKRAKLIEVTPDSGETVAGPFTMRFHRVTHSIPDGVAVAIDTPAGTILHSGDFKLDQTPLDGRVTDLAGISEEGRRGVHLFLSDSTNAEDSGSVPSEREVGPVLEDIFRKARGRIVTACFSSHVHRVQQICDAARAVGRKVAFLGRSMNQNMAVAGELGYLTLPEADVVPLEAIKGMAPDSVVVVSTGSQGEPMSALSLMAAHENKWVKLQPGDTVVLSSSKIPGNETSINRTIDGLYRTGADVFHVPHSAVHVSGHAAGEELQTMLNLVRPQWFIPVHGEVRHLLHHARLAEEVGVPRERILICEDGDVVDVKADRVWISGQVEAGVTYVDGLGIGDVGEAVLRDRRKLAGDGFAIVVVTVDRHSGAILGGPEIIQRGFVYDEEGGEILEEGRHRVELRLKETAADGVSDPGVLKDHIRRTLAKHFFEATKRKPVIVPVIMEV